MRKNYLFKFLFLLCTLVVGSSSMWAQTYKKVTAAPSDWSGEYLIVFENGSTANIWTGVDANSNFAATTISSNTITKPTAAASVTIATMTGGYSIKVNGGTNDGKYISGTSGSNTTNFNASAAANTLTFSSGVDIASNTSHFVFNSTSGTTRFRYYKSTTYSGNAYKKPQLYKKAYTVTYNANGGTGTMTDSNSPYFAGSTVTTMTNTFTKGGYDFTGWNTAADGSGTAYSAGATFTLNANTTLYAQWASSSNVATPTFSVAAGTYNEVQSVELSCSTPSSTIYYTTDGTNPSTSSAVYSSAIAVNVTTTIKAFAVADGLADSEIASATYTLKCPAPTITIPEGAFVSTKDVTISVPTGTSVSYSTDNGENWSTYSLPFAISATTTVKAKATKSGWADSDEATETFTKEEILNGLSALAAKTNTSDASYYVSLSNAQVTYVNGKNGYMEDGDTGIYIYNISPTLNKVYNGIFQIKYQFYNKMPELKAITAVEGEITDGSTKVPTEMTASDLSTNFTENLGRKIQITGHTTSTTTVLVTGIDFYTTYYNPSFEKDHTYTIVGYPYNNNGTLQFRVISAVEKPDAPTISPAGGEFSTDFTLTLSAVEGATIHYTTNGDTPTSASTTYNPESKPTISAGADVTVKAVAVLTGMTSEVASASYVYTAISKPAFSPTTGTSLYYGETVAISCDVDGSTIYYTTDNSTPTASSTEYSAPIAITANSVTIKAIAKKGDDYSTVAEATYTLKDPAAPTFSIAAGDVPRNQVVTISSAAGTKILYSTDGSDPTTDVGSNSKDITITAGMTIKAKAVDGADNESTVASAAYTIAQVAKPTISVAAGLQTKGTQVHITTATDDATIYYTLDGTAPTASSNVYNGYVVINSDCTLKAIALKENYIDSEIASAAYTVAGSNKGIVFSELGYDNADDVTTVNETDVTLTFAKNTGSNGPKYYSGDQTARIYKDNLLTITSDAKNITTIAFNIGEGGTNLALNSGAPGTLSGVGSAYTWQGKANSVVFKSSGTVKIKSITVYFELSEESTTVGDSKFSGFCSEHKLDFSGTDLNAYKAKVSGGKVVLTKVADGIVPAYTGVVLSGNANDYNIPISTATATTDFSDNEMVGVTQRTQVVWNVGAKYNYILQSGQFNKATDGYLKPNLAYLSTGYDVTTAAARSMEIVFDDEPTAIKTLRSEEADSAEVYDLQGRKIAQPKKGLYIVNGRKVVVK